jgi:hypothetical protein
MLGASSRCGERTASFNPAAIRTPSDGSGGLTPAPRNESAASSTTAFTNSRVESTMIVDSR